MPASLLPVALAACPDYGQERVNRAVGDLFTLLAYHPTRGSCVLVKPNLLRADPSGLTCTSPQVLRAACLYLLDHGATITIGDSPAFGDAGSVAKAVGITAALADTPELAGIPIVSLKNPVSVPLTLGGRIPLSRQALEADSILNIPRLKAHIMVRVSCAVKNLYGCICGTRKAVLHAAHGDKGRRFPAMILDIPGHLPPVMSLVDAVTSMHITGPSGGKPYRSGFLAASPSPVAVDTLIYGMMEVPPADIALWEEAILRGTPGARAEDIQILGEVKSFPLEDFRLPATLRGQSFSPPRLLQSALKRAWANLRR